MLVEIYGIDESAWKCPACHDAKVICEEGKVPYKFVPVLWEENGLPKHDLDLIKDIAARAGFTGIHLRYPVIFVDGKNVKLKNLRTYLSRLGYDTEL